MIEKLDEAIAEICADHIEESLSRGGYVNIRPLAKAVLRETLKALETPTPAMIEAGYAAVWGERIAEQRRCHTGFSLDGETARIFTAMIRAAQEQGDD